jgi:hypothetical protein
VVAIKWIASVVAIVDVDVVVAVAFLSSEAVPAAGGWSSSLSSVVSASAAATGASSRSNLRWRRVAEVVERPDSADVRFGTRGG